MVKNLPTVERSTKIRFGKNCTDDQAENTIVFNASDFHIDATIPGTTYMTPIREQEDEVDSDYSVLFYNNTTKEITLSTQNADGIIKPTLEIVTGNGNVASNIVSFRNPTTSITTLSNVGIANDAPTYTLAVGSNLYVDDTGSNVLNISGNVAIVGDLNVTGAVTTIDTTNLTIKDAIIELGKGNFNSDTGIIMDRTGTNVTMGYLEDENEFIIAYTESDANELNIVPSSTPINTHVYGNLNVDSNLIVDTDTLYVHGGLKRVGIGISSPSVDLHVEGNTYVSRILAVGDTLFADDRISNVGINTNTPSASLDVNGNAKISGNVTINTDTFYVDTLQRRIGINTLEPEAELDVQGNIYVSDDIQVDGIAYIISDLNAQSELNVTGNAYVSSNLVATGNVDVQTDLNVTGNAYVSSNLNAQSELNVTGNAYMSSNLNAQSELNVTGNAYVSSNLVATGNVDVQSELNVTGNAYVSSNLNAQSELNVTGNAYVSSNLVATGNVDVQTDLNVTGNAYVSSNLVATGNVDVQSELNVTGNTYVSSNLNAQSELNVTGNAYVSSNLVATGNVDVQSELNVTGNAYVSSNLNAQSELNVTGNAYVSSNLVATGNVDVQTDLNVTGNAYVSSNLNAQSELNVTGNAYVSSNLVATGNVDVQTDLNVTGNAYVSSNLVATGNVDVQSELNVTGNAYVSSNLNAQSELNVTGNAYVSSNLVATGNVDVQTDLNVTGNAYVSSNLVATGNVDVQTDLNVTGNAYVSSNLVATGNVDVQTDLNVTGNAYVSSNLNAQSELNVTGNAYVSSNLVATGNVDVQTDLNVTGNAYVSSNLVATGNVDVQTDLNVTGNAYATEYYGDGGLLSNVTLQVVSDHGNATSSTIQFTNPITAFTTDLTSSVELKLNQLANVVIDTTDVNESLRIEHTLVYDGSDWVNDYPKHTYTKIFNDSGSALPQGSAVYIKGTQNANVFKVGLAQADDPDTMPVIGVVAETISTQGGEGIAVTFGKVSTSTVSSFVEGETLYVSATTPGSLSNVKPYGTALIQNVGVVTKSGSGQGAIFVTGIGRANDIPNAPIVLDETDINYVYVNNQNNDLKKIEPSNLLTQIQTLQQVTDTSNTTSNTTQFTNATTSLVTTGNVEVGGNISIASLVDPTNRHVPMVGYDGFLEKSPIYFTSGGTYVVSAAEAEFTGNLTLSGNTSIINSESVTIEDRIFGIGANNAVHNLDTGIMMEHKDDGEYANIALIYHAEEHRFAISYTQNTFTDDHIVEYEDENHRMLVDLIGNVEVQHNLVVNENLSVSGNTNIANDLIVGAASNLFVDVSTSRVGINEGTPNTSLDVGGDVRVQDTTDSTSTTTGALTVLGGVGVVSNIHSSNVYVESHIGVGTTEASVPLHVMSTDVGGIYVKSSDTDNSRIALEVEDTFGGDPIISWNVPNGQAFSVGIDNSLNDTFNISNHPTDVSQDVRFTMTSSGTVTLTNTTTSLITSGNVDVQTDLNVTGNAYVSSNLNAQSELNVTGNAYMSSNLNAQSELNVTGNAYVSSNLVATGNVDVQSELNVTGNAYVSSNLNAQSELNVTGNAYVSSNLVATGNVDVQTDLNVTGNAYMSSNLVATGNVDVQSELNVTGNTYVSSNLNAQSELNVTGNAYVSSNLVATGNVDVQTDLNVTGNAYVSSNLVATGNVDVQTDLNVTGNAYVSSNLVATGNVDVQSELNVTGNTYVSSNLNAQSELNVTGNAYVSSNLVATGNVDVQTDLNVTGNAYVSSNLVATGNVDVQTDLNVTGNAYVSSNLQVGINTLYVDSVNGKVGIANSSPIHDLDVGSNLFIEDTGSNVLTVNGGILTNTLTIETITVTPGYSFNLENITSVGATTSETVHFQNNDTSLITNSNVGIGITSPETLLHVNGGIITNSDAFARKLYSYSEPTLAYNFSNVALTFASNAFSAKITAQLVHDDEELSTLVFYAQGGTRSGTTSTLNIATNSIQLFGNTNIKPWSPNITFTPTKVILEPSATGISDYSVDIFVEYLSSAATGKLETISVDNTIVKTFLY